jgi:hypothetical protein
LLGYIAAIFSLSVDREKVGKAFQKKIPAQLLLWKKIPTKLRTQKKIIAGKIYPPSLPPSLPGYLMVHPL